MDFSWELWLADVQWFVPKSNHTLSPNVTSRSRRTKHPPIVHYSKHQWQNLWIVFTIVSLFTSNTLFAHQCSSQGYLASTNISPTLYHVFLQTAPSLIKCRCAVTCPKYISVCQQHRRGKKWATQATSTCSWMGMRRIHFGWKDIMELFTSSGKNSRWMCKIRWPHAGGGHRYDVMFFSTVDFVNCFVFSSSTRR